MTQLVMKIVIDVDEYEQLKFAASKLAESEKIIKEHLKIKEQHPPLAEQKDYSHLDHSEQVLIYGYLLIYKTNVMRLTYENIERGKKGQVRDTTKASEATFRRHKQPKKTGHKL